jgi:hypothetical protein
MQSSLEFKKGLRAKQQSKEEERRRDEIDNYRQTSTHANEKKSQSEAERKDFEHELSKTRAGIYKTERERRQVVESEVHGVEAYRQHSEYKQVVKVVSVQEAKATKNEQEKSRLHLSKQMKQTQQQLEKGLEQDRIEEYKRTSEFAERKKTENAKTRREDRHSRSSFLASTSRNNREQQKVAEKELEQDRIEAYKRASEYARRKKEEDAKTRREDRHSRSAFLASNYRNTREKQYEQDMEKDTIEANRINFEYKKMVSFNFLPFLHRRSLLLMSPLCPCIG